MSKEIEQLLHQRADAVKAKEIEKAVTFYKDDLRVFDLVEPLGRHGKQGVADRLTDWFSNFGEIEDYSFSGLEIFESGDQAACSLFNHVKAIKADDTALDMYWRETLILQKQEGNWLIVHAHDSVPFDAASGKASMALKP